jgi:hypothetical protein
MHEWSACILLGFQALDLARSSDRTRQLGYIGRHPRSKEPPLTNYLVIELILVRKSINGIQICA